jgi:hypothetical protein
VLTVPVQFSELTETDDQKVVDTVELWYQSEIKSLPELQLATCAVIGAPIVHEAKVQEVVQQEPATPLLVPKSHDSPVSSTPLPHLPVSVTVAAKGTLATVPQAVMSKGLTMLVHTKVLAGLPEKTTLPVLGLVELNASLVHVPDIVIPLVLHNVEGKLELGM